MALGKKRLAADFIDNAVNSLNFLKSSTLKLLQLFLQSLTVSDLENDQMKQNLESIILKADHFWKNALRLVAHGKTRSKDVPAIGLFESFRKMIYWMWFIIS